MNVTIENFLTFAANPSVTINTHNIAQNLQPIHNHQQGQQMSDIQQMLAQFQQQMMAQFQQQQKELQNVFPVLADAQCETDRCLSDVIAGGARGRGRERIGC